MQRNFSSSLDVLPRAVRRSLDSVVNKRHPDSSPLPEGKQLRHSTIHFFNLFLSHVVLLRFFFFYVFSGGCQSEEGSRLTAPSTVLEWFLTFLISELKIWKYTNKHGSKEQSIISIKSWTGAEIFGSITSLKLNNTHYITVLLRYLLLVMQWDPADK